MRRFYEKALRKELELRGLVAVCQASVAVSYKGEEVGVYVCDLLVDSRVICEIKACSALAPEHTAQLLNYLKATGVRVGLLLNFGTKSLQFKRLVF